MSKLLSIVLVAGLLFYPFATFAADYGSQTSQTQQGAPVAQSLVREGDFAIKLATELNLGSPANEAEAEDMLATAGIAPLNGWISDYPMTPEIVGQLNDSIAKAAEEGIISVSAGDAKNRLNNLVAQMELPAPAGSENQAAAGTAQPSKSDQTVINNYYYEQGPPVITYYPPPVDYVYLYDWVPYPVVWFGFWFPGFFICHNFTTVVTVTSFPHHHFRRAIVTNRIVDPSTRTVVRVDPVVRSHGAVRPETVLRTSNGRTFTNIREARRDPGVSRPNAFSPGFPNGTPGTSRFISPQIRRSPGAIAPKSGDAMRNRSFGQSNLARNKARPNVAPQGSFSAPSNSGRPNMTPSIPQRSFNPQRLGSGMPRAPQKSLNVPSVNSGRQLAAPGAPTAPSPGSILSSSSRGERSHGRAARGFGHGHAGGRSG